jgi:predicted Zn-dependent protease
MRLSPSLVSTLLAACTAACTSATTPRGGGLRPPPVSAGQEIRAGQRAARETVRTLGLVVDQALQDYVQQVGTRLAGASERPQLEWTFRVVDDPMPNAFALPGGYVFVTRGLLGVLDSEAELAGVLAHGIGHVNARHGARALGRQSGPQLGVWAVPIPELRSLDAGADLGAGLLFAANGPEAESQADDLAFNYMLAAGYDLREMPEVFAALGRLDVMGGGSALPSWLAVHPDPGGRVEAAARRAGEESTDSLRQNRAEYLDQIEDLVYGHDARQGFFRGSTFLHPELRFRVDLPSGWRYRNLAQAVVATSPGREAAIQLSIVEQVGPDEAAARFASQPGVQATGAQATDVINGNLTVTVPFRTTGSGGAAEGVASWIRHGGRTYQIVGIAGGQDANGHAGAFRGTVRSFASIGDAGFFDLRPNRINIVRLGRSTTFEDFNRRYPSVIDAEEVALLNRVAGPGSRLRAGGRMKRVVKG